MNAADSDIKLYITTSSHHLLFIFLYILLCKLDTKMHRVIPLELAVVIKPLFLGLILEQLTVCHQTNNNFKLSSTGKIKMPEIFFKCSKMTYWTRWYSMSYQKLAKHTDNWLIYIFPSWCVFVFPEKLKITCIHYILRWQCKQLPATFFVYKIVHINLFKKPCITLINNFQIIFIISKCSNPTKFPK